MLQLPRTWAPGSYNEWSGDALNTGVLDDVVIASRLGHSAIELDEGADFGAWESSFYVPDQPFGRLVASSQTTVPPSTYGQTEPAHVETFVQVRRQEEYSRWFPLGKWAAGAIVDPGAQLSSYRMSTGVADPEWGSVEQDTYLAPRGVEMDGYRIIQMLTEGEDGAPSTRLLAAVTSRAVEARPFHVSQTTMEEEVDLDVPTLSQYEHAGEYSQLNGGGKAWCSPTSLAMVLRYFGKQPDAAEIEAMPANAVFDANGRRNGDVAHAALFTFDDGTGNKNTGNWSFNTAHASSRGVPATVRQFADLQGIEQLIQQELPAVVTLRWDNSSLDPAHRLDGAPKPKTDGHLMVVRGFTESGDVIVNDPAAPTNNEVRRVYNRAQFEYNWLRSHGGIAYVFDRAA